MLEYARFLSAIAGLHPPADRDEPDPRLLRWEDPRTTLASYYAPFDYVNRDAKIVIIGITPGRTQMNQTLRAAVKAVRAGASFESSLRSVKAAGSFSGQMRETLVALLNRLGYQRSLEIDCCSRLWSSHDSLVHFCSLLRYPVFVDGQDYNGVPPMLRTTALSQDVRQYVVRELAEIRPDAVLIPLGDKVLEVMRALKAEGAIRQQLRLYKGEHVAPPHPSGANSEAIALVLAPRLEGREAYAERMYREYRDRGKSAQSEQQYKNVRRSRWDTAQLVREAYALD